MSWDGRYSTSRDADKSLEDEILDAGLGIFSHELPGGGTYRQTEHSINVYYPDESKRGGYAHIGYNADTNEVYEK